MTTLHGSNLPLFRFLRAPFLPFNKLSRSATIAGLGAPLSGEIYEDVELLSLTADKVTIRHEFGIATIARADLPREIQQSLIDNSEMAEPDFASDDEVKAEKLAPSRAVSYSEAA